MGFISNASTACTLHFSVVFCLMCLGRGASSLKENLLWSERKLFFFLFVCFFFWPPTHLWAKIKTACFCQSWVGACSTCRIPVQSSGPRLTRTFHDEEANRAAATNRHSSGLIMSGQSNPNHEGSTPGTSIFNNLPLNNMDAPLRQWLIVPTALTFKNLLGTFGI